MTNLEHYKAEVDKFVKKGLDFGKKHGVLIACKDFLCSDCEFFGGDCAIRIIQWLMEEYTEKPKLTQREKHFVEYKQDGWLARDKSGDLCMFQHKPSKETETWNDSITCAFWGMMYGDEMFKFIAWEDEEPWNIEEMRNLEVQDANFD